MKTPIAKFGELPQRRGRHRLSMTIAPEQVPIYWQIGQSIHPCAVVTAMVHGDEFEGFVAALDVWKWVRTVDLQGSLMILPVCNPAAAQAATRHTPTRYDGLNLARTFPGVTGSSYTQQLAHALWNLIRDADALIDLHSGGVGYDYARLAGYYRDTDVDLAACFPKAFLWPVPATPGVLSYEFSRIKGKVSLGWECGGEARLDRAGADDYAIAVKRVLARLGVVARKGGGRVGHSRPRIGRTRRQTCSTAGWFLPELTVGSRIKRGQVIGQWIKPDLRVRELVSRHSGIVIAVRTLPRVEPGDYLVLVGELV
ncbi:MAG: hypothetical protein CMJ21_01305 [Phycisphaerae bacterium]|jgi:predicted deacylase|nr:hypothetical protein [Phycisphaerae bacterium]